MSRLVGDAIFRAFVAADRPVRRRPPLCDEEEEEEEPRKPLMEAPPPLMTTDSEAECILLSEMARTSSTLDLSLIDARWVDTPRPGEVSSLCEATEKLGLAGASSSGASSSSSGASSSSSTTKKAFEARVLALTMEAVVSEIHSWLGGKPSQLRAPAGGKAWSFAVRRAHRDGRRLMSVCRRWRDYVGGNRAFFGRLLVPISQRLPRVAQLHGTATKWMTVDGGRIEKARKERSFRNPERSGGFLEVASLRSRSRSPDDLDQKGEGFGPRRRTTRRDGGEEEKDVVYFFDDDDDDPGRSDDERSSSSSSSSSSDVDDLDLSRSRRATSRLSVGSLVSFEDANNADDPSSLDSSRIPTEATVALWAALGLLPNLECLEMTRCKFAPNRSASPANVLSSAHLGLRSLCLYRCAGLTADVLADLVALCPNLETLELHHACPWKRQADAIRASGGLDDDEEEDDGDGSFASSSSSVHHHHQSGGDGNFSSAESRRRRRGGESFSSRRGQGQGHPQPRSRRQRRCSERRRHQQQQQQREVRRRRGAARDEARYATEDDSVAAWLAGIAMGSSRVRNLRLGDGVDDDALEWIAQLAGTALCGLNLMHTYALDNMAHSLETALSGPRLLALSIHVDGKHQSCDDAARAIAASASCLSLRVLALGDHVPVATQADFGRAGDNRGDTNNRLSPAAAAAVPGGGLVRRYDTLTDAGLAALARCRVLSRLMLDDAGAITVQGAAALVQTLATLEQLVLRRCFAGSQASFTDALALRDLAAHRGVAVCLEPRDDLLFKSSSES